MNLFDSIGLSADPFSTSPNVDLFYPALEHRQCLEGLELAIRMRRGLSVIRGGIGVGKTTISRKLIQNFKDEPDDFDFYLILDPKFESEIILLKHIIELFGVNDTAESVQDCRNIIENYLLRIGVEQGKTLVLIVDEGQNLPGEMLDVFRTLLNFETDEYKLLQLIIFGQPEMGKIIHQYPNFEDRISFDFEVGPISIDDMRGMINHRLQITGGEPGDWFKESALVKIHKNTQGYPRKITQLCHQLLLAMISEEKDEINEEMVQRVIAGKIDTGGLLKQKKKNYNEIAVNKLLDVLRKDEPETTSESIEQDDELVDDDDWIGGSEEAPTPSLDLKPSIEEKSTPSKDIQLSENTSITNESKKPETPKPIIQKDFPNSVDQSQKMDQKDFLPTQGNYPSHIKASILSNIPLDQTYTGIHVDQGKLTATVINDANGKKTLLTLQIHHSEMRDLDPNESPDIFMDSCKSLLDELDSRASLMEDTHKGSVQSMKNRNTIALTVDDKRMQLRLVDVPKENQKDKKQIIEWSIKKELPFPIEDSTIHFKAGKNDKFRVGIGEESILESIKNVTSDLELGVRAWYPVAQSIHNAYIWNYPEYVKSDALIIHIGEKNSLILGYSRHELLIIKPLFIGLQSLHDTLRDNGLPLDDWSKRTEFQVPETFLRSMGKKVNPGKYDDVFRPVFDSWRQEIDRTVNGIRKEFKISNDTKMLISGSAGDILHFDDFMGGMMGLETSFLNPMRNLAISESFDEKWLGSHPTVLTASIGSSLHLNGSVNISPKELKQDEVLRWANRIGIFTAAASLVFFVATSVTTKLSINSMNGEIVPMMQDQEELNYVEGLHLSLKENKSNVEDQMNILSYDTEYFNHVLAVNRFLSFYTPKEIKIDELAFQEGWEREAYQKIGRDLVKVVKKEDEHLRIVKIAGNVHSNSILLDDHFNSFIGSLEESSLFQNVEIVSQASKAGLGKDNLQFILKCII